MVRRARPVSISEDCDLFTVVSVILYNLEKIHCRCLLRIRSDPICDVGSMPPQLALNAQIWGKLM